MLPEPLHPAVVHFPIVLAAILPLAAISAWALILRGNSVRRSWTPVLLLAAFLSVSAWAAVQTGEAEEERVEEVVAEVPIHEHEEAAELFLPLSFVVLVLVAAGLLNGRIGSATRGLAALASVALLIVAYRVGHTGGQLVYEHGAAEAYAISSLDRGGVGEGDHDEGRAPDREVERSEEHR